LRQLLASAMGEQITVYLLGRDAVICMPPLAQASANEQLQTLMEWWYQGLQRILPTASKTALALLSKGNPYDSYNGGFNQIPPGESKDPCLSRIWPDFAALSAEPEWEACSRGIYGPLQEWVDTMIQVQKIQDGSNDEENP